jgi:hypothetical protein
MTKVSFATRVGGTEIVGAIGAKVMVQHFPSVFGAVGTLRRIAPLGDWRRTKRPVRPSSASSTVRPMTAEELGDVRYDVADHVATITFARPNG